MVMKAGNIKENFIILEEWRDKQLNKILNE